MSDTFAKRLKDLRKEKKLTQIEFAKKFNIANGTVGNWESGNRQPDYETLQKIADFFSVSVDYLLGNYLDTSGISFARKIVKKLSEEREINISDIENKLGVNYATFRSWYNGSGDYFNDATKLAKIADFFSVTVGYLLGEEEETDIKKAPSVEITEGEQKLLELFRRVPESQQQMVLSMIEVALQNLK